MYNILKITLNNYIQISISIKLIQNRFSYSNNNIIEMVFLFWFDMIRIIHQLIQKINNKIADKQG